jgi:uncharacterized OB-fold protein
MSERFPQGQPHSDLQRRRDELAEQVAELHWNLGGLTYEMAIRDHFRLDVLIRRAAMLQERDAELAEVDRLLHMQESSVAGNCASCGAVRSRGAVFCWQCGAKVMEQASIAGGESEAVTTEIQPGTAEHEARTAQYEVATVRGDADLVTAEPALAQQELGRPVQANT